MLGCLLQKTLKAPVQGTLKFKTHTAMTIGTAARVRMLVKMVTLPMLPDARLVAMKNVNGVVTPCIISIPGYE